MHHITFADGIFLTPPARLQHVETRFPTALAQVRVPRRASTAGPTHAIAREGPTITYNIPADTRCAMRFLGVRKIYQATQRPSAESESGRPAWKSKCGSDLSCQLMTLNAMNAPDPSRWLRQPPPTVCAPCSRSNDDFLNGVDVVGALARFLDGARKVGGTHVMNRRRTNGRA